MTNERKAEIIRGLTEYAGVFEYTLVNAWGLRIGVTSHRAYQETTSLVELITNPKWATGVWSKGHYFTVKEQVCILVTLHLEGKDDEVWEELEKRWEQIKDVQPAE